MKAVILAAGEGKRMWPLATAKPKHLLPIAGRPMISILITTLASAGIKEVSVVVGFKGELIQSLLGDGTRFGLSIEYLRQPKWTGTASAVEVARQSVGDESFLAIYGDLLVSPSCIETVLEKAHECSKVMGIARLAGQSQYGVVEVRGDNLTRIREKPLGNVKGEGWINTGIYVLDRDIFRSISGTGRSKRAEYELTSSLQHLIDEGKEVKAAAVSRGEWMDVGRPWDLLEANERVLMNSTTQVKGTVESGVTIKGPVSLEDSACIKSGSYVEGPAYVGEGSTVGPNARIRPCTSIGNGVIVGASCEIKNSIVMTGTRIPHLSYVGDSVIGENCNVAAGTITANIRLDEAMVKVKLKGRTLSSGRRKLGTIMGDGVQTGINSSLMPGVRIGPGAYVGPGVVVYDDVEANQMVFARQTVVRRMKRQGSKKV
ncbi:MAG TPA: bifunctional sugar-1-phosphate nucleotidylyltransferase/acetyltransferase [Candidatus Acidoferrales bacterium]|nr:bifunctional sugar-1-phosphate nucleotidylyltransferase/acetyltransferase [Candidatus Acidoferrales bacterium]